MRMTAARAAAPTRVAARRSIPPTAFAASSARRSTTAGQPPGGCRGRRRACRRSRRRCTIQQRATIIAPQRFARHSVHAVDQSVPGLRARLHLLLRAARRTRYLDLSPGLDFETKLFAKPDAAALLRAELAQPGYRCDPIALGTNTDPYQPIEREWKITRSGSSRCSPSASIRSRSRPRACWSSATSTCSRRWPQRPRARVSSRSRCSTASSRASSTRAQPAPQRRLQIVKALADAGVPVGVSVAPVIPQLTDKDLEAILEASGGQRRALRRRGSCCACRAK